MILPLPQDNDMGTQQIATACEGIRVWRYLQNLTLLIVLALSVISCMAGISRSIAQSKADSWVGANVSQLLQCYGPANRSTADGAGGRVFFYDMLGNNPQYWASVSYSVNRDGRITSSNWNSSSYVEQPPLGIAMQSPNIRYPRDSSCR